MNVQNQFKVTVAQIKQRLFSMLQHHMQRLAHIEKKSKKQLIMFNESLLEQWYQLLTRMAYLKQEKSLPQQPIRNTKAEINKETMNIIYSIPPKKQENLTNLNVLLNIEANHIDLFEINRIPNKEQVKFNTRRCELDYKKGLIRGFSSATFNSQDEIILIGGCRQSDPNIKSNDVLSLNLASNQIMKIIELPYGVSSHATIKLGHSLFVVGGNRDFNMVSKKCLEFNTITHKVTQIKELHFPSSSHTLLCWQNRFIYKFGGIGSCFGQWDLSPYIQRYDTTENCWQIVNPKITISQNLIHHFSLLTNSIAYQSNRSSIVIIGGHDFKQRGSKKIFQIQVRQEAVQDQIETVHQIVCLGELANLQPGGFLCQQKLFIDGNLFTLQTLENPNTGFQLKVVKISNSVSYI